MKDIFGYETTCFQCDEEYEQCECTPHEVGFEFEGFTVCEPNVDLKGKFLVDPVEYYGDVYMHWANKYDPAREDDKYLFLTGIT